MGGYTNFGSLDDGSTGDGIGAGLTDSIDSYSGIDPDPFSTSDVTGSDLTLDSSSGITGLSVFDLQNQGSPLDSTSLSGVSDQPPDPWGDSGEAPYDTLGEGSSTPSMASYKPTVSPDFTSSIAALGKFGSSFAAIITGNTPATVGGVPIGAQGSVALDANGRPIVSPGTKAASLSSGHSTLIIGVALALAAFLIFSGVGRANV